MLMILLNEYLLMLIKYILNYLLVILLVDCLALRYRMLQQHTAAVHKKMNIIFFVDLVVRAFLGGGESAVFQIIDTCFVSGS